MVLLPLTDLEVCVSFFIPFGCITSSCMPTSLCPIRKTSPGSIDQKLSLPAPLTSGEGFLLVSVYRPRLTYLTTHIGHCPQPGGARNHRRCLASILQPSVRLNDKKVALPLL